MVIKTNIKIERPAPTANIKTDQKGIVAKIATIPLSKVQEIAVAGGVVLMPSKKPLTKLNAKVKGSKINKKMFVKLEKIYSIT